jgi:hypothetical protein
MHKATGNWDALKNKRPIDADDLHVSPERDFLADSRT